MTTLKTLRNQAGLSVKEVADRLGETVQTLYRYEQGLRRISLEQILRLVEVYDVTTEEIIKAQLNSCLRVQ